MKISITDQQKAERERLHNACRDKRVCDRIKATPLASEGRRTSMIAPALRLHRSTIVRHISEFLNNSKRQPENDGPDSKLNAEQTASLIRQLSDSLFHHIHEIMAFVTRTWEITSSIASMKK